MSYRGSIEKVASLIDYELHSNASPFQIAQSLARRGWLALDRVTDLQSIHVTVNEQPVREAPRIYSETMAEIRKRQLMADVNERRLNGSQT